MNASFKNSEGCMLISIKGTISHRRASGRPGAATPKINVERKTK
jgi:hypothetical protein